MISSITAMMNVVEAAKRVRAAQKFTLEKFAVEMQGLNRCLRELERYEGKKRVAKKPQSKVRTQRKPQPVVAQQPAAEVPAPIEVAQTNPEPVPAQPVETNSAISATVNAETKAAPQKKVRSVIVPPRKRYKKRAKVMKGQSVQSVRAKGTHGS